MDSRMFDGLYSGIVFLAVFTLLSIPGDIWLLWSLCSWMFHHVRITP